MTTCQHPANHSALNVTAFSSNDGSDTQIGQLCTDANVMLKNPEPVQIGGSAGVISDLPRRSA
jgi:hypothetical protein